jgi:hypothetical protein
MSKIHGLVGASAALVLGVGLTLAGTPASASGTAATSLRAVNPVPSIAPAGAELTAVYLDSAGKVLATATSTRQAGQMALFGCTPVSGRDNPHYSGGDVSGHGWWDKGSCSHDRAKVYNCLYEYYTDGTWRQKACSPKKTLKPGGGSSNRTVARAKCANRRLTSWRNHVDVDVIGQVDSGEKPYNQANVECRVY